MSVGSRKTLITSPHGEIGQGQFTDSHDLILAVIQLIHRSLLSGKIFQRSQEVTLLTTIAFPLGMFLVTLVQDPIDALPQPLQFAISLSLEPVAFAAPLRRRDSLRFERL